MAELWEVCRAVNAYVMGPVVAVALFARLIPMVIERERWLDVSERHRMLWFIWVVTSVIVASLGARHYAVTDGEVTWLSGARTLLLAVAVGLCVWWPQSSRE